MAAPAAPPVTSVTATAADLIAFMAAHPTNGVYIYTDVGQVPTGAGIAASGVNSALQTNYESDSTVRTAFETDATLLSDLNIYTAGTAHKVKTVGKAKVYNNTDGADSHFVVTLDPDTALYINQAGIVTEKALWYKIKAGTYVNDYIRHDDVMFLTA